ncbi:MAG: DUF4290 domain-containing protein [Bacteroidales bacterium]|nr:DUF4290 domain-containing protein [Bacteroidales bacterium]
MLEYNNQKGILKLPEYGRNIQQMVEYCTNIEDRDERNRCAKTIIQSMGNLFPQLRDDPDFKHKLWDHIAIMSGFTLDIDYPYEVIKEENLHTSPQNVKYQLEPIRFRHYGKIIEQMICRACEYPEGEERNALIMLIANHMKKLIYSINKEDVDDEKIFNDLHIYSRGKIKLSPETHKLHVFKEVPTQQNNNKKGSKKKK